FLAVQLALYLWIVRVERGEQSRQLRTLPGRVQERAGLGAELLHRESTAPVLEQDPEPRGGSEAGDGRDVEREDDGLGNARDLPPHRGHDAPDVQIGTVALLPGLEPHEDRAEVGLIRARDHAVSADG